MLRKLVIGALSAMAVLFSTTAFAQGTAAEASVDDIKHLEGMGETFVLFGDAEKWQLDRARRRLNLTISSNDFSRAADLSHAACRGFLSVIGQRLSGEWTARVYLLNGEVAGCTIACGGA